jgi:hypothetical protein
MKLISSTLVIALFICHSAIADERMVKVVKDRLAIQSLSLKMDVTIPLPLPGQESYREIIRSYEIDMIPSRNLFRQIKHWKFPTKPGGADIFLKNEKGCFTDNWSHPSARLDKKADREPYLDVRMLGLDLSYPSSMTARLSEESVAFASTASVVEEEQLENFSVTRAVYPLREDTWVSVWYAEDLGGNPVRTRFEFKGNVSQVDTKYAKFDSVGIWFPTEVQYREYNPQGEMICHEIAQVSHVVFNTLQDKGFSIDNLPIKDGRAMLEEGVYAKRFNAGIRAFEDSIPTDVQDLDSGTYIRLSSEPPAKASVKWIVVFVVSLLLAIVVAGKLFYFRQNSKG